MRRRPLALAAALAFAGAVLVVTAPVADAVGAPTVGWWSRLATSDPASEAPAALPVPAPTTPATVPAGATVPPGQFLVEGTPDGATAIAAIRWELQPGDTGPALELPIAAGSSVNPQSIVLACRAATPWEPPADGPGSWDVKPLTDAAACVNGVVAADLSAISFGLQPLVSGTVLDIVLAPGRTTVEGAPGLPEPPVDVDGSSFRLLFDPPPVEALQVVPGSADAGGQAFVPPDPAATPSFGPVGVTPSFATPGGGFDVGSIPSSGPPVPVAAPALDPEDLGPSVPDIAAAVPASAAPRGAERTIGFVMLALAGLVLGWTYWSSSLGAGASVEEVGGLSRFARVRDRAPTPLT